MQVFKQVARVRAAQAQMSVARQQLDRSAGTLLARGRQYPLTTMGIAAGAGFALGSLDVQPLRVPGAASLLSGGVSEAVAYGTRVLAELAAVGVAVKAAGNAAPAADMGDADSP